MSPRREASGRFARRNVEPQKQELPNSPKVKPQGEVTNAEFREKIVMLSQVVTNQVGQQREAENMGLQEFLRMIPPIFFGSRTLEVLENIMEELKKVFDVMHVISV